MDITPRSCLMTLLGVPMFLLVHATLFASPAFAQQGDVEPAATPESTHSLLDFVTAGGFVGYIIIAMSIAAIALLIDTLVRLQRERLLPHGLVSHSLQLAEQGRLSELLAMNKASPSMFGRIVGGALDRARHGIDAV